MCYKVVVHAVVRMGEITHGSVVSVQRVVDKVVVFVVRVGDALQLEVRYSNECLNELSP